MPTAQYLPFSGQVAVNSYGLKAGEFAQISVYTDASASTYVTIYGNSSGVGGPISNPLSADQNGDFTFWTYAGTYFIQVQVAGASLYGYYVTIGSGGGPGLGYFNVMNYGAVGDGVTPDDAALQAAIAAGQAASNCPVIYFPAPPVRYLISTEFTFNTPVRLLGASAGQFIGGSEIRSTNTTGIIFNFVQGSEGSSVSKLTLDVSGTPTAGAGISINFTASTDGSTLMAMLVEDVSISNCWDGIDYTGGNFVSFNRLLISNCVNTGCNCTNGFALNITNSMFIDNNYLSTNLNLTTSSSIQLVNIQCFGGAYGIVVTGSDDIFGDMVIVDSPKLDGILVHSTAGQVEFTGSWVGGAAAPYTGGSGSLTAGYGINLLGDVTEGGGLPYNVMGFKWHGGYIRSNHLSGVHISAQCRSVFFDSGCTFSANGQNTATPGLNTYGVAADANATSFYIRDCTFGPTDYDNDTQTCGVYTNAATSALSGYVIPWVVQNCVNNSTLYPLLTDNTGPYSIKEVSGLSGLSPAYITSGTIASSGADVTVDLAAITFTPMRNADVFSARLALGCGTSGSGAGMIVDLIKVPAAGGTYTATAASIAYATTVGSGAITLSGTVATFHNASATLSVTYYVDVVYEHPSNP